MNSHDSVHDVVGVGFGPSNLALATALDDNVRPSGRRLSGLFLERQPTFAWHRNMLLPSATMQVSFLKDLATFRNPLSTFTFVNYLHESGRLVQFVNNRDFHPTRAEFHRYLEWAQAKVGSEVRYGAEVIGMRQAPSGGPAAGAALVDVRTVADGRISTVAARNVVVSTGLRPRVPEGVVEGDRVWHSSRFLSAFRAADRTELRAVAVVGAGQSAAEITRYLHDELPDAEIYSIMPVYGYTVADSTPFANQVFDPGAVDDYYFGTEQSRDAFWRYHANTNYSVVDDDVIRDLYRRSCDDDLAQRRRLHMVQMSRVRSARTSGRRLAVTVDSQLDGASRELQVDAMVLATGYSPMDPATLLGELADDCLRDDAGRLVVGRDYRVATVPGTRCGIYLQGGTEHSHGLSASLLSNIAVRSGEIVDSIDRRVTAPDADQAALLP